MTGPDRISRKPRDDRGSRVPLARTRRRPLAGMSLRKRLVLSVTSLLAAACLLIGIALPLILRGFLVHRVDEQLQAASGRALRADNGADGGGPFPGDGAPDDGAPDDGAPDDGVPDDGAPDDAGSQEGGLEDDGRPGGSPQGLVQPGQEVGTIAALERDGVITDCARLDFNGDPIICSDAVVQQLASITRPSSPMTIHLHHIGDYRVSAIETEDGLYITGLSLGGVSETVKRVVLIELAVSGVVLVIAAVASAGVIGRMLAPLQRVASTAKRVSDLPLDRGEVELAERVQDADADPRTEVGQVGYALNQMLNHVESALESRQQSEQRVRSFVADASHELRTPLAAIRGYAELTRRSREEMPELVAHALSRVESESLRMTSLVEDLLLLARLDSGRPLDSKPVDLAELIINAVSDAHAAGPDYDWKLQLPEHETIEVTGDRARLHQVLANLLANARTHTPPGTVVTTSLTAAPDGRTATITVCDNGPGISEKLLPTVFDRFARGDSSRSREKGSTGLGLAIVSAVVSSHGGTVTVDSEPGRTCFSVVLPTAGDPPHRTS